MIVFLEDQASEYCYFQRNFTRSGETLTRLSGDDFIELLNIDPRHMERVVEAVVINRVNQPEEVLFQISCKLDVPVVVLVEQRDLEKIKQFFSSGADDVVLMPVHYEELILRLAAIKRRCLNRYNETGDNSIILHFDGRDPVYQGQRIELPRRERRVLEYLAFSDGRRVTRAQIFDAVYGMFEQQFSESVVESHICKLRKKLKAILGHDPISSIRYQGYQLDPAYVITERNLDRSLAA